MLWTKVTYSASASSSLSVRHQPLHKNCTYCLGLFPGAITILPYTNHLATYWLLACLFPYENYNHRVSSASLNLCQDLCPSSPLLCPREHACKESIWLYTRAEKASGKAPAKQSMQRTAFSQQNFVKDSMTHNFQGEGRQQIVGWKEINRIQRF